MDGVKSLTTRDLPSDQSGGDAKHLTASFDAAARKPVQRMIVPPPPPLPPQAPPPPQPSGGSPRNVLQAAQYLSANWDKWGMHNGVDFNNPPAGSPPDEVSTLAYFGNNPVLANSIVKDAGGTPGDPLSKAALDQFISDAEGDGQAAADALWRTPSSSQTNSTIQDLSSIVANWHAWGFSSGLTPFSNPPPSDLPPDAQAAVGAITSDPYLLSQIGNHTGSGAITRDDVANFLNLAAKNPVLLNETPSTDTHVQDWLGSLGGAVSDQDKSALGQTANDAQTVLDFFNAYPNNASELNSEVPPDVKDAENRLLGVDAIKKQITTSDGTVTRYTVGAFLGNLDKSADAAKSSWESFQKSNPNADPTVTHLAADASILQADSPILDEAGPGSQLDGEVSAQDLKVVAGTSSSIDLPPGIAGAVGLIGAISPFPLSNNGDASLPSALKNAASLFSSPGMFANLDRAGADYATTKPDGLMDANNLGKFISDEASKMTPQAVLAMVSTAANQNMVAGVDVSKLGADVFKNPQNYSGAQKAAVLQQLEALQVQIKAGEQDGDWNTNSSAYGDAGINPNPVAVLDDIQGKIDQLSKDPATLQFIGANSPNSMQAITNADPGLKSAMQNNLASYQNGDALKAALDGKDSDGNPVTTEQGLTNFIDEVTPLAQAVGSDGKPAQVDLRQAAQNSGEGDKLEAAYKADILSGNELKTALAGGAPIDQAVQQFMSDAANFSSVLPSSFIKQNAATLQNNFSNTLTDSLLGPVKQGDLNAAFADKNGNLDTGKLASVLQQIEKQDPTAFKDSQGVEIPPDKILSAFKYVWDDYRQFGGKLPDALAKGKAAAWGDRNPPIGPVNNPDTDPKPGKPTGPSADAYNSGMMHIVSALFGAGALVAKGGEGGSSASFDASVIANSFQVVGALMEGGSKYTKENLPKGASAKPWVPSSATLKTIENAGKVLGGGAGAVAGAVGIFGGVQALEAGDKIDAGVDLSTGILQTLAGTASAVEGLAGLGGAGEATLAALGTTSSILGGVSAGVGALATLGLVIYQIVETEKQRGEFTGQVIPQLTQWGITGADGPPLPGQQPLTPPGGPGGTVPVPPTA